MKIGQKFSQLTEKEYYFYIDNYQKYTDFNTLGLYRSLLENEKLSVERKLLVRDYAHQTFGKFFDFLQLKDPVTFVAVSTLGQELTEGDKNQLRITLRRNREKMLKDKQIKHRNFGSYSKHSCGYEDCPYNGVMIRQDSILSEGGMHFHSDKNPYSAQIKSERRRKARKTAKQIIELHKNEE